MKRRRMKRRMKMIKRVYDEDNESPVYEPPEKDLPEHKTPPQNLRRSQRNLSKDPVDYSSPITPEKFEEQPQTKSINVFHV